MRWACGLAVVLASSAAHAQTVPSGEPILARVGDRAITESEFIRRFELTPGPSRQAAGKLEEEKAVTLYSLVAEKLLADEARQQGLDKDSAAIAALEGLRKVLARDELYRVEITRKVTVSRAELNEALLRVRKLLQVEYLFFEDSTAAAVTRAGLHKGRPLSAVQFDSSAIGTYDTASVIWGDADPVIENAAYQLKEGRTSPVIRAGIGYYILRLRSAAPNNGIAGMPLSVLRERVEQKIRLRKERERLDVVLAELMRGKVGYGKPDGIRSTVWALRDLVVHRQDSVITLQASDVAPLVQLAAPSLGDTLAVAGSRVWSVGEILQRLCVTGFSFARQLSAPELGAKINLQIRIWVQQELLEEEAMARHLDEAADVKPLLEMWTDSYLAGRMKTEIEGQTGVRDDEVWRALHEQEPSIPLPRVRIETFRTASLPRMRAALDSLSAGRSFSAVARMFGESVSGAEGGHVEELSIADRPPVGSIAWRLKPGAWYGPVRDDGGYLTFRLLQKILPRAAADTAVQREASGLRAVIEKAKERGRLNYSIAALAKREGYAIFEDRLAKIPVTPLPMVTYKVIGFGGRMFAVPFVDRQIEWLNVETEKPLP